MGIAIGGFVLLGVGVWLVSAVVSAQAPWPTPPPGEPFPFPNASEADAPVQAPSLPSGSESYTVRPQWPGYVPLIPPINGASIELSSSQLLPVTIRIDAGTYVETVQIAASPFSPSFELGGLFGRSYLMGLSLWVLDKEGGEVQTAPRRPVLLTLPVAPFVEDGLDPDLLFFAQFDGSDAILLPTQYHRAEGIISTRLTTLNGLGIGIVHDDG
ncbi:MAG: hypothetical protein WD533_05440 [Dehalococcoidia bacterium]